ncbi:MAG: glycosyltransferase family 2 protein [Patescibacteria group bacterium]|nr:glycosyltransferase family 2 protein [Patescibacteria group bacterium]MDD4304320.1 glycosyltransferase family 2 protein [Patescibacteria group bacterium]MDD4695583.1 glycosyltransferase family 2 protein [Patescibacteria group bacterium]
MNKDNPKIFIVIPAWNEEKNIAPVLDKLIQKYNNVVVIDDSSSDNTSEIIKKYPVVLLKHIINRDQGASLQTGNDYALKNGADIIVHFDADGQFLVEEISDLINPIINDDYDIVFGSRFLEKKSKIPLLKEKILFPMARITNKLIMGINTTDPQSGFRAMTADAARKIIIKQDRKAHCSEILHKAFKYKLKIKEVPMTVIYNRFGQNFSGGIDIVKDLLIKKIIK